MIDIQKVYRYGFFALIALIIVILSLKGSTQGDKLYLNTLQEKIEALENDVLLLENKNDSLRQRIGVYRHRIDSLGEETKKINAQKTRTIRYYEKRIRDINNLTTHELDSFFTARYGLSSDTAQADSN